MFKTIWKWIVDFVLEKSGAQKSYRNLKDRYDELNDKYNDLLEQKEFFTKTNMSCELYLTKQREINNLKDELNDEINARCLAVEKVKEIKLYYKNTISQFDLEKIKQENEKEISKLNRIIVNLNNQILQLNSQPKNPLGAGRKERGSVEEVERIIQLRKSGKSLGKIAKIMTDETGNPWGKSTVSNIINRAGD